MAGKMKVIIVGAGGEAGEVFELQDGINLIGRWDQDGGACPEVDLDDHDIEAKISRKHAVIELRGGQAFLEDVGSMNGTYLRKTQRLEPNRPVEIVDGDEFLVGKTLLRFVVD